MDFDTDMYIDEIIIDDFKCRCLSADTLVMLLSYFLYTNVTVVINPITQSTKVVFVEKILYTNVDRILNKISKFTMRNLYYVIKSINNSPPQPEIDKLYMLPRVHNACLRAGIFTIAQLRKRMDGYTRLNPIPTLGKEGIREIYEALAEYDAMAEYKSDMEVKERLSLSFIPVVKVELTDPIEKLEFEKRIINVLHAAEIYNIAALVLLYGIDELAKIKHMGPVYRTVVRNTLVKHGLIE